MHEKEGSRGCELRGVREREEKAQRKEGKVSRRRRGEGCELRGLRERRTKLRERKR